MPVTTGDLITATMWNDLAAVTPVYGNWTPVLGGSGGTSGQAYSVQRGTYAKLGRLVACQFYCVFSTEGTITGNLQVQGLPFTVTNTSNAYWFSSLYWSNLPTNWVNLIALAEPNTVTAYVRGASAAAGGNNTMLTATDIDDNSELGGTIVYLAPS